MTCPMISRRKTFVVQFVSDTRRQRPSGPPAATFLNRPARTRPVFVSAVVVFIVSAAGVSALVKSEETRGTLQESNPNYSQFRHENTQHARLPCLLCHRRQDNSPRPTLPGKAGHAPCTGCHAQQFSNPNHPICSICHTNTQSGNLKSFPRLQSFNVKFDHAAHSSVGASCATCHRGKRDGVSLSIPTGTSAHRTCFTCHTAQAKSDGKNLSSCSTCHELGHFVRSSERPAAFRMNFRHANHDSGEGLKCVDCHRFRPGVAMGRQVTSPVALNHRAPARVTSCATCHNGKRAFGGDDFSVCTRCHSGSRWQF
jgi:c(7)-type cytochrome triheme protein